MRKIGFFGGCFNPPTFIHINLANSLIQNKVLDKVIFVPVGDYYKKPEIIESKHRYNMLKLYCEDYKNIDVEDISIKCKENLYAIDTFKLINDKYQTKNIEIYYIMGSDNFNKMPKWKNYEELIKKYKYIVIERLNYEKETSLNNVQYYKTNQTEDISSTTIRQMLKENRNTQSWIGQKIYDYIKKNNLYN